MVSMSATRSETIYCEVQCTNLRTLQPAHTDAQSSSIFISASAYANEVWFSLNIHTISPQNRQWCTVYDIIRSRTHVVSPGNLPSLGVGVNAAGEVDIVPLLQPDM